MFEDAEQSASCFQYLHNIGFLVYNNNTKKICTDPGFLAKCMACFVFDPEHDKIMYGKCEGMLLEFCLIIR